MRRLTLADTERLRATPGASALLFITDRCPVGCRHCSVSAEADGAGITDWELFAEIVAGIAAVPELQAVAISGGEPFAERRGLSHAVSVLRDAGKDVVVFTSGYWAPARPDSWITRILRQVSTVVLSTDRFHPVGAARPAAAAQAIIDAGCHLIVQLLAEPGPEPGPEPGLPGPLAAVAGATAEVNVITPLRHGRGAGVFHPTPRRRCADFGRCPLTRSPTIRYDGTVLGCCGEAVIAGGGPAALRSFAGERGQVAAALRSLRASPVLQIVGAHGPGALAALPPFAGLRETRYADICRACWAAHDSAEAAPEARRMAVALAATIPEGRHGR
ncbi:4Fe-4S cluster-binding domain-containing protein [Nonomuraea sp. NPDC003709]|uniref:4Fe-4S cluster-binding domain-containing protein n=1 Tax=Nonomuraea sp. NPDC003709 TaxID=3154450 RepID=UPI0033A5B756